MWLCKATSPLVVPMTGQQVAEVARQRIGMTWTMTLTMCHSLPLIQRVKVGVAKPTAIEKRHMARVAGLGCLVCGSPATLHHVTGYADRMGRAARSHKRVVPLCPRHHMIQFSTTESVEALGHRGFYSKFGIDLMAEAERLWSEGNG
jgi:hypothetical protein